MTAMPAAQPERPRADAAARRARRAVLRAHHPDLGGDPAELIHRLAALTRPDTSSRPVVVRRPRGLRGLVAWWRERRRRRTRPPRVH
ncbi:hypothetical protein [Cellulomonas sp. NS3]|uniref:hypothetical protein n=1 Tax=Cellulomonas sp. NS3 TaxID=2973977 RepID=UPI002163F9EA|nr:hypothetical protein [Cellulomonas sp. NS3]